MIEFIKKKPWRSGAIALVVIVIVLLVVGGNNGPQYEEYQAGPAELTQTVLISGSVDSDASAELSFGQAGSVTAIEKQSGDVVDQGDIIVRIQDGGAQGELLQARAALDRAQASLDQLLDGARDEEVSIKVQAVESARIAKDNAFTNLQNTQNQQNTLVDNAYKTLLNTGLDAIAASTNSSSVDVTISGFYNSLEEGSYTIRPYSAGGGLNFNVSGLESGIGNVNTSNPQPLGTRGLFVLFSSTENVANRTWTVSIPNTQAASYPANLAAYNNALQTRTVAIASAQASYEQAQASYEQAQRELDLIVAGPLQTDIALLQSDVTAARGRLISAQKAYNDTVIRAPFDGIVGRVDLAVGDLAQRDTPYVAVVGGGDLEIVLQVPQIDVARVAVGDMTQIMLDAYGDEVAWQGEVTHIDSVDTQVDGVSVYETRVRIVNPDERIRIGMTAKAEVVVAQEEVSIAIPGHFISREGQEKYVLMYSQGGEDIVQRSIRTGIEGGDGMIEVTNGLQAGDIIVREL